VQFAFTEEQDELRQMVREMLTDLSPEAEVRRLMETDEGWDRKVWSQFAASGLLGLAVPEEFGGAGCGLAELGVVLEEAGRSLLCAPYLSSVVLATSALLLALQADTDYGVGSAAADLLPALVAGERTAALAYLEGDGDPASQRLGTSASRASGEWRLSGAKTFVLDGHTADDIVVLAQGSEGPTFFVVTSDAAGFTRTGLTTLDQTRRYADLGFDGVAAVMVGPAGGASKILTRVQDIAATAIAAEQVGGAGRVLEMAVEYAKIREQFGRPIGSFQAIKHQCADMLLEVESGRSAAYYALWAGDAASPEFPVVASVAKAYCSDAFFHCAAKNIQIHGGIGFTWEHPAHLYLKRAKNSQLLFGAPAHHRELVAQRLGL
jgi:alkylation response protein AidB-like acyl-CoA dehydrogenase